MAEGMPVPGDGAPSVDLGEILRLLEQMGVAPGLEADP